MLELGRWRQKDRVVLKVILGWLQVNSKLAQYTGGLIFKKKNTNEQPNSFMDESSSQTSFRKFFAQWRVVNTKTPNWSQL